MGGASLERETQRVNAQSDSCEERRAHRGNGASGAPRQRRRRRSRCFAVSRVADPRGSSADRSVSDEERLVGDALGEGVVG